ncbi:hypothetical protein [Mycolicibacterium mucogenicum]|uniref:hypothetical protein n=1 Tax=Mycolicibacterium mucogenicum TaxID=56689 RepID=UPI001F1E49FC|nr:hypothetical protein [Mycolicibacterium mucogenicum]
MASINTNGYPYTQASVATDLRSAATADVLVLDEPGDVSPPHADNATPANPSTPRPNTERRPIPPISTKLLSPNIFPIP